MKALIVLTLLCQAMTVGTFFAFSTFVLPALDRCGPEAAIRSMQSINSTILGSLFMAAFGLSTILGVALPVADRLWGSRAWSPLLIGSGALYALGVFGATLVGNVPLNDGLANAAPLDASTWLAYRGGWLAWNHVRTLAGALSMVAALARLAR